MVDFIHSPAKAQASQKHHSTRNFIKDGASIHPGATQ
jgi:hypothetical protein